MKCWAKPCIRLSELEFVRPFMHKSFLPHVNELCQVICSENVTSVLRGPLCTVALFDDRDFRGRVDIWTQLKMAAFYFFPKAA